VSTANMPRVYNQRMELECILEMAISVGYRQAFNDLWTATFTLLADDPKNAYCKPFNYVEIYDERRRIELFRIVGHTLTRNASEQGFNVYECEHVITTLLDNVMFQYHQIGNIGVFTREVIEYVLSFQSVENWRLGRLDFNHQFLYKWESTNLLKALFSIPRPFMDEWHFTYDTTVYPWIINLERAQTELSCEIRHGKNMQGIEREIDATNLVTRILPLGYGEGINQLTIESVNNGLNFLEADTIGIWGVKETIWEDRRFEDAESMRATASAMLERLKNPWICYTVTSIDLFKRTMQDFDQFIEGRIVRVIDRLDGINVDTRIVEIVKPDVTKADITVTIENQNRNVAGSIAALQERARINDTYAQGFETYLMIPFLDNADQQNPAFFEFYIPQDMVNINEAILRIQLLRFRAYSRAVRGGGGTTQTTTAGGGTTATSSSGGGTTQSTTDGGATTQSTTQQATQTPTTSSNAQQTPTTTSFSFPIQTTGSGINVIWHRPTTEAAGDPSHSHVFERVGSHGHNLTIPPHQHSVTIPPHSHTVNIPAHSHQVIIPSHSHSVTVPNHTHTVVIDAHSHQITIPDHTHAIEFGIFQGEVAQSISIRVDNNTVPIDPSTDLNHLDARPFFRTGGGGRITRGQWHRLEIIPDRMTRVAAWLFLRFTTNSRGGGIF